MDLKSPCLLKVQAVQAWKNWLIHETHSASIAKYVVTVEQPVRCLGRQRLALVMYKLLLILYIDYSLLMDWMAA